MPQSKETIKKQILDAAHQRFIKYGFKKTNMMEIAEDCDMSPGNIYRFFKSKDDMGAAVVSRIMEKSEAYAKKHLKSDQDPLEKLKDFTLAVLEFHYGIFANKIHLFELINVIYKKRPDLLANLLRTHTDFVRAVLEEGCKNGQYKACDLDHYSALIYKALRVYLLPYTLMSENARLETLKLEAINLIDLLHQGFKQD